MADSSLEYNKAELLSVMSSRVLEDGKVVFAGAGVPLIASVLAQKTHAPHLTILFEGGAIGPDIQPGKLPPSTNEARAGFRAVMLPSCTDMFLFQQRGFVDYGFLGGAQIDRFGNINTSMIGNPRKPKVRLPGSGGANDIVSACSRIIIATYHEKRRFVEKVDFVTSPGYLNGGDSRRNAGLIFGRVELLVSDLGMFRFDGISRQMRLEALHPNVEAEDVVQNTGFEVLIPPNVSRTKPPTSVELQILRELDPEKRYIGTR